MNGSSPKDLPGRRDGNEAAIEAACRPGLRGGERLRVGIDTVEVAAIEASLASFGERFEARLFTDHERAAARGVPARQAERLAARFAAKEAVIKAFDLAEIGVGWRDIEVHSEAGHAPRLRLHGRVAALAVAAGLDSLAVSLSHESGHACAMVAAIFNPQDALDPAVTPNVIRHCNGGIPIHDPSHHDLKP